MPKWFVFSLWLAGFAWLGIYTHDFNAHPVVWGVAFFPIVVFAGKHILADMKKKNEAKREEASWRKDLTRRAEEERVLGHARNESAIALMQEQASNLIRQQEAGLNVEKELMAMREKMLAYENSEFEDLIGKINKHL